MQRIVIIRGKENKAARFTLSSSFHNARVIKTPFSPFLPFSVTLLLK